MKVNFLLSVAFLTLTCPLGAHNALAPSVLSFTNLVEFVKKNINRRVVLNITGNFCDFLDFVRLLMDVVFLAPNFACIPSTKLLFWEQVQLRSSSKETAWVLLLITLAKGKLTKATTLEEDRNKKTIKMMDELATRLYEDGAISQRIREEKIRAGEPEQEEMDLGGEG